MRRALLVLVLVVSLALVESAATIAHAEAPAGPRLALLRFKFSFAPLDQSFLDLLKFDLLTTDAAGGQVQILQGAAARSDISPVNGPAWSPDGSLLAIAATPRSKLNLAGDIHVLAADGSGLRQLTQVRNAAYPVFSSDGKTIYFARVKGGGLGLAEIERPAAVSAVSPTATIWAVGVDGTGLRQLTPETRGVVDLPGSVSPLSGELAYTHTRCRHGKCRTSARLMSAVSGADTLLARNASTPSFSPDGRLIALGSFRDRNWPKRGKLTVPTTELYLLDRATGTMSRLTHTRGVSESFPSWDQSGQRLAYLRFVGLTLRVFEINANGTCTTAITKKPEGPFASQYLGVAWQPGPGREAGPIAC